MHRRGGRIEATSARRLRAPRARCGAQEVGRSVAAQLPNWDWRPALRPRPPRADRARAPQPRLAMSSAKKQKTAPDGKKKVALITGITGQDGSYLAEFLLRKNYMVHGIIRRSSSFNTGRIEDLYQDPHVDTRKLILHYGDLTDSTNCFEIVSQVKPDELYNLGAQSHVKVTAPAAPAAPAPAASPASARPSAGGNGTRPSSWRSSPPSRPSTAARTRRPATAATTSRRRGPRGTSSKLRVFVRPQLRSVGDWRRL